MKRFDRARGMKCHYHKVAVVVKHLGQLIILLRKYNVQSIKLCLQLVCLVFQGLASSLVTSDEYLKQIINNTRFVSLP